MNGRLFECSPDEINETMPLWVLLAANFVTTLHSTLMMAQLEVRLHLPFVSVVNRTKFQFHRAGAKRTPSEAKTAKKSRIFVENVIISESNDVTMTDSCERAAPLT